MCRKPLVVPPIFHALIHVLLQAVELGCWSEFPGDLPLPHHLVLLAYFVVNARKYRRPEFPRGPHLGVEVGRSFRTAAVNFSTQMSIGISLSNSGMNGIRSFKLDC